MLTQRMIDRIETLARQGAALPPEGTLALCDELRAALAYRDALTDIKRHEIQHVVNTWSLSDATTQAIDMATGA